MQDALLYLSLWLSHPKALTGWRSYLVLSIGKRSVWLLATDTAESFTLTLMQYRAALATKRPIMLFPRRTITRIVTNARAYRRLDAPATRFALALLRRHQRANPHTYDPNP